MIGWFRSIDTLRSLFEFKFKFQIRTPLRLWLGATTIARRHQQTHPRVFTLQHNIQPLPSSRAQTTRKIYQCFR
jgi:hypothetical protein